MSCNVQHDLSQQLLNTLIAVKFVSTNSVNHQGDFYEKHLRKLTIIFNSLPTKEG